LLKVTCANYLIRKKKSPKIFSRQKILGT